MKRIDLILTQYKRQLYRRCNRIRTRYIFATDRANVSSDLNKLVKDKRLLKQIRDLFVLHRNEHFVGNAFKRHNFIRYICN